MIIFVLLFNRGIVFRKLGIPVKSNEAREKLRNLLPRPG